MAPCSGRLGLLICIWGQIAPLGERKPPAESERAGNEVLPAKEGGAGVTEAAEEGCGARQDGQAEAEAEAEEEDRAREVAAA
jgi:hypothetical protein